MTNFYALLDTGDNTEWWVNEIEERIAKVEALLSIYQETLE